MATAYNKPLELFEYFYYTWIRKALMYGGFDVLNPKWKKGLHGHVFEVSVYLAMFCVLYTVYAYDLEHGLNALSTFAIGIQGAVKIAMFSVEREGFFVLTDFARNLFAANMNQGPTPGYEIMMKWAYRSLLLCKLMIFSTGGMCCAFLAYPTVLYFVTGKKEAVMPIYLPFNEETTLGFTCMTIIHLIWVGQTMLGITVADINMTLSTVYTIPMVELFEKLFGDMDDELLKDPRIANSREIHDCLRNLVLMHQEMCKYLSRVRQTYAPVCFADVYTNGSALCFIIYCLMVQDYYPHYFMLLTFFVKLFIICFLGTLVEYSTDRVLTTIQSSRWYLLPVSLQRCVLVMMIRAQNPTILWAGDMPLNLDTFVNVLKTVYKVAMLMSEMIE